MIKTQKVQKIHKQNNNQGVGQHNTYQVIACTRAFTLQATEAIIWWENQFYAAGFMLLPI